MVDMNPKRLETRDQEALERVQDLLDERGQNELFVGTVVYALSGTCNAYEPADVLISGEIYLAELNQMIAEGYQPLDHFTTILFESGTESEFTRFTVLVKSADIIRIPEGLND